MGHITVENIDKEMEHIIKNCTMTRENLKTLKLLHDVRCVISEEHDHELTYEEAEVWVHEMEPPARWTMEQTSSIMKQKGFHHNPCEFYAVMNMLVSDYGCTIGKYGVDRPDLWADLAHDFLDDGDAVPGKTAAYYRFIAEKS